ncbi:restriction endonuclease subunit S [Streptococcus suis]|uniref:restriction endonuclease subunit S n=1 Tax=Streptococcus suis TaxID=1307 RepID=UPI000CF3B95A|nr:restriction endonuclease subunit S [Streptococcus suis]
MPNKDRNIPKRRFKEFENADAWELRKLGEVMEVTSVKRIHQSDWTDFGVRFLRARDIVAESKNESVSEPLFISQKKYDEYTAISGKVTKGDLLVTGVGTIGIPMLIEKNEPIYFKDGNIIWFKNENHIDGQFFYYSFIGKKIQSFIKESAGIGTVGTFTINTGKNTPIDLPVLKKEQEAIGTFFSTLDRHITLHQRKLEKLKNLKKALLNELFV